jgi:hypothetical protein
LVVDRALEEPGPHARAGDAVLDVPHEHVHHRVGDLCTDRRVQGRAAVVEEERDLVVGVAARRHDDVEVDLLGDPLDPGDVAPQTDHGGVDDRPDARRGELVQLLHRVRHAVVLVPPLLGVVLLDVGAEHEHVLVHQRLAELGGVDGTTDGLDLGHCSS